MVWKNRIWLAGLVAGALCAFVACSEDNGYSGDDTPQSCTGNVVEVEGESFCVYERDVIVEEGFRCPPMMPNLHEFGGLGICAPNENIPVETLEEVERVHQMVDEPNPDPTPDPTPDPQPDLVMLGESCESPARLLLGIEPQLPSEEYITLFVDSADADAISAAMASAYGFEVTEVFTIINAFSAALSPEMVEAIRCHPQVVQVEQSRTDIPPPGDGCRDHVECFEEGRDMACYDPDVPLRLCGVAPREECFTNEDCFDGFVCHAIFDGCSPDGVGTSCEEPCVEDADCRDENFVCIEGGRCAPKGCNEGAECLSVQICDPDSLNRDQSPTDFSNGCQFVPCVEDAACDDGLFCVNRVCQSALGTCDEVMLVP